jgi:hypothetical protein
VAGLTLVVGPAAWLLHTAAPAEAGALPEPVVAPPSHGLAAAVEERRGLVRGPRLRMEARPARLEDLRRSPRPVPRALVVPRTGVRAPVVPVGVEAATRALELPNGGGRLGWYRHGPAPGQPGTAVIAGHVDWADAPGAFFELRRLRPGDRVRVQLPGGVRVFEVIARRRHGKDELPPRLFARSGPPLLALVTCAGDFDERTRTYDDNLIVWARPV